MFTLVPLMFRNVLRNRRRSLLTLGSMAVSLALLALMTSLYYGLFLAEDASPSGARRVLTRHKVSLVQTMPISYRERIAGVDGVMAVSPWVWFAGTYREPKDFFPRLGADPKVIFDIIQDYRLPPEQLRAFQAMQSACVAGEATAKKFGWKLGEKIVITGDIYPVTLDLTLVGIYEHPPQEDVLIFNSKYLDELLAGGSARKNEVGLFISLTRDTGSVPRVSRTIDAMFANSPAPTLTQSAKEFQRSFLAFIGNVKLFLMAICLAVTFTILLVSANTIAMAVRERTRELAIVRTLGYTPGEIIQLIVGESLILATGGGLVGLGIGYGLGRMVQPILGGLGYQGLTLEPAAVSLGLSMLIGAGASVVPAVLASRQNVVEALRFTG